MNEKISGISLNTMFRYDGYSCLCAKDTVNTSPDEAPTVTLKVCPDISSQLLFSYAPKDGLNMTGVAGSIHEKNILGKLLALPKGDGGRHAAAFHPRSPRASAEQPVQPGRAAGRHDRDAPVGPRHHRPG